MSAEAAPLDVVIIGGGPAGLAAGLWLARYRRRATLLDAGHPRNRATWAVHGYPGVPDLPPAELLRRLRDQALGAGLELLATTARDVSGSRDAFLVHTADDEVLQARRLLLAFGRVDRIPEIPGIDDVLGTAIFHCPDCDGPSLAGARVGILGHTRIAATAATLLRTWTDQVSILTHGRPLALQGPIREALGKLGVPVHTPRVERILSTAGRLEGIRFANSDTLSLDGIMLRLGSLPASTIGRALGCAEDRKGNLRVDSALQTTVPGVFAAGDLVGPPFLAIHAAASGVHAALSVHRSLLPAGYFV